MSISIAQPILPYPVAAFCAVGLVTAQAIFLVTFQEPVLMRHQEKMMKMVQR